MIATNDYAWVGARQKQQKPFWEAEAETLASGYSRFKRQLMFDWKRVVSTAKENGIREANQRLTAIIAKFKFGDFRIDQTEDEKINDYASAKSMQCGKIVYLYEAGKISEETLTERLDYILKHHGLSYDWDKLTEDINELIPTLKRFSDIAWWRRKTRRAAAQRIEEISRELGYVNRARGIYCSDLGREEHKRRKQLNLAMLENTVMENDDGEQFTLADLSELSNSNPVIRRTELMVRISGFEQYANELGYEGWFYTITCPSKYHAASMFGARNDKFAGYTQRDSQQYLCRLWAAFRAKAKREGWEFFGFRVAEPHHDGTPHWHLLLFVHPNHAKAAGECLREYSMREDRHEPGAFKARFKAEKIKKGINPATGNEYSAAGYIAKYISKNIDGEHIDKDLYDQDAKASAASIAAWASRNSIRQFQQIGGPSVTAWRELRRLGRLPEEELLLQPAIIQNAVNELERLNQEGASTAWAWYCRFADTNGKISMWQIVKTATETVEAINQDTGEVMHQDIEKPAFNFYREMIMKNHGVRLMEFGQEIFVQTRFREWKKVIVEPEEAAAIRKLRMEEREIRLEETARRRAERDAKAALAAPWTGVNNCTALQKHENSSQQELNLIG